MISKIGVRQLEQRGDPRRRLLLHVLVPLLVLAAAAAALVTLLRPTSQPATPQFVAAKLGASRPHAPLTRQVAPGITTSVTRTGFAVASPHGSVGLALASGRRWHAYSQGALRRTSFGREAVAFLPGRGGEQYLVVDRRQGHRTWSWRLDVGRGLTPMLRSDGSVLVGPPHLVGDGLRIAPVAVLDRSGKTVTPAGARWGLERLHGSWRLTLALDDAKLPLPYVVDPAITQETSGTASSTTTSSSLGLGAPAGIVAGDVMVAQVTMHNSAYACAPSGWTSIDRQDAGAVSQQLFYKVADATDVGASYTFSLGSDAACSSASSIGSGGIVAFYGVRTDSPIAVVGNGNANASSTSVATPSVTAPSGDLLLAFFGLDAGATVTGTGTYSAALWNLASTGNPSKNQTGSAAATKLSTGAASSVSAPASARVASVGQQVALALDQTAPTQQALTSTGSTSYVAGTTLWYDGNVGGSFTLQDAVTDDAGGSGAGSAGFPVLTGTTTGWTPAHVSTTPTTPAGGPYVSSAYTWTAGTSSQPSAPVYGYDRAGNKATTTLAFKPDTAAPTATITFPSAAYYNASTWTGPLAGTAADAGSGVKTVTVSLQDTTANTCWNGASFGGCPSSVTAAGTTSWTSPAPALVDGHSYTVTVQTVDNVTNTAAIAASQAFTYDATAPTNAFSLKSVSTYTNAAGTFPVASYPGSGTTIYYNGSAGSGAQSFAIHAAVTDTGSGAASLTTSGFAAGGSSFTHSENTQTTTGAYDTNAYIFTPATSGTASTTVSTLDNAGNSAGTTFSLVNDTTGPTGGALTVDGTAASGTGTTSYLTSGASVTIDSRTDYGSDAGAGYVAGSSALAYSTGSLAGNVCSGWSAATTIGAGTTSVPVASGNCYRFTLSGEDVLGNVSSLSTVVKVDTSAPSAPTLTLGEGTADPWEYEDNTGPTLYFNPAASGSHTFTVQAASTDAQSGIGNVAFSAPAGLTCAGGCAAPTTAPYSQDYSWTSTLGAGSPKLAQATNNAGVASAQSGISVVSDAAAPSDSITFPSGATPVFDAAGWPGSITGTTSDGGSGTASVGVSIQDTTVGGSSCWNGASFAAVCPNYLAPTSGTLASWSFALAAAKLTTNHSYTVTVKATDSVDNSTTTSQSFAYDTTQPTVSSITATEADGAYSSGTIHLRVDFSEPVTLAGGTPALALDTAPARSAAYVSGSGTSQLAFDYTIAPGDDAVRLDAASATALTLGGGTLRDAAGNDAVLTVATGSTTTGALANAKSIAIDTTAPAVTNVTSSPATAWYRAGQTVPITVSFDEPVTVGGTPTLTLANGATASYASGSGGTSLTFDYTVGAGDTNTSNLDYSGTSALAAAGGTIRDAAGNDAALTLAAPGTAGSLGANAAIAIDTVAPTVSGVGSSAADGAYGPGATIPLTVTFDEPVTVTGTPALTLSDGGSAAYTGGSGTDTLAFTTTVAAGQSSPDLDVTALAGGTIADAAGNPADTTIAAGSLSDTAAIVVDTTAPTVAAVGSSAADGAYGPGATIPLAVTFDEPVTVTGTPALTLSDGGSAAYTGGSGTDTLAFTTTVAAGQSSPDLDVTALAGGTIADAAGNPADTTIAAGSLSDTAAIVVDTTAPTVGVATPASDGTPYLASSLPASFGGSAGDDTSLAGVAVAVRDGSGDYWNGTAFEQPALTFEPTSGAPASWSFSTAALAGKLTGGHTYTITARATDAAGNTQTATRTFRYGTPDRLAFDATGEPQDAQAGGDLGTVEVDVLDQFGNPTTATSSVTLALASGTGDPAATLSGRTTVAAVNGVATFTGLSIDKAAAGYELTATSGSLTSSNSSAFSIAAAPAASFDVALPATATAGSAAALTVTARDRFGNVASGYGGTVVFSGGGAGAALPPPTTFTVGDAGVHTFFGGATLEQSGSETIGVADSVDATVAGSGSLTVDPDVATHLDVSAPAAATAGSAFAVTVTARDRFENLATGYNGTVRFGSGSAGSLPADAALAAGTRTFGGVVLTTAGSQTLTATDTGDGTISGAATIAVGHAALDAAVSTVGAAPATVTADGSDSATVTVAARDAYGNPIPGATVSLQQGSGSSSIPAPATTDAGGAATFAVTDTLAEDVTYGATVDGTVLTGTAAVRFVPGPADAAETTISATPTSMPADGVSTATVTVQAKDAQDNDLTASGGVVTLATTAGTLGGVSDDGDGTYTAALTAPSSGATATVTGTIGGDAIAGSATVTFGGPPSKYLVTSSSSSPQAGAAVTITAQLADANGSPTGVAGKTITWSSTGGGTFDSPTSVTDASGTATVTFTTGPVSGSSYTVTATDDTTPTALTGTSAAITTGAGVATHFDVTAPANATAGSSFSVTVTAKDRFDNTASGYTGTVTFTGGGADATLPADTTFAAGDDGSRTFSGVVLTAAGTQTIGVEDTVTASIAGSDSVAVGAADAATIALKDGDGQSATVGTAVATAPSVLVTDRFGNPVAGAAVTFAVATGGGSVTGASATTNGSGLAVAGSWTLGTTAGADTLTASASGLTGSPVTFGATATPAAAATLALSGPATATAGVPFSLTVTAKDRYGNDATGYAGTVHFTGPGSGLPADAVLAGGTRTFAGVVLTAAGARSVSAADTTAPAVAGSTSIDVGPGAVDAAASTVTAARGTVTADGTDTTTVTVTATDAYGNPVSGAAVALQQGSGSSTISGPATTDGSGKAAFAVSDTTAETVTFAATVGGTLVDATVDVAFAAGPADHLAFVTQPSNTTAGASISPSVEVELLDAQGNRSSSTATVSLASSSGTLGGTTSRAAVDGVATFDDLSLDAAGTGYTLDATSGTLGGATSTSFDVAAGAASAAASTVAASPGSVVADGSTAATITVTVTDAVGNPLAGKTVALAQSGGAASVVSSPSGPSGADGRVTFTVTDTKGEVVTYTATDTTDGVTLTPTADVTFLDEVPPTATIGAPADGATAAGTLTLTATGVADPGSGVGGVTFHYCDSTNAPCDAAAGSPVAGSDAGSGTWTGALDTTSLVDGHTYTWLARATDGSANTIDTPTRSFRVDNSTPVLSLEAPTPAARQFYDPVAKTLWLNASDTGSFELNASATDAQSGVAKLRFGAALGTAAGDVAAAAGSASYGYAPGSDSGTVAVTAFNGTTAGDGANSTSASFAIAADGAAPAAFALGAPAGGAKVADGVELSAAPTDAGSGIAMVSFFYCDASGGPCAPSIQIGAAQTSPVLGVYSVDWDNSGLPDGSYAVDGVATDNVGHTATSAIASVVVDNSAPDVAVAAPVAVSGGAYQHYDAATKTLWLNGNENGSFKLAATADDPDSGVASVDFPALLGTGASSASTSPYESSTYGFAAPATSPGSETITATNGVTDPGALTSSDSLSVDVDGTPPSTLVSFPLATAYDSTSWNGGCTTPGLCGTVSDGGASGVASVRLSIEDATAGTYWDGSGFTLASQTFQTAAVAANTWSYPLDRGDLTSPHVYVVEIYSTDRVGNEETHQTVRFTYGDDTGAPATTLSLASATHAYLSALPDGTSYDLFYGTANGGGDFRLHASSSDPSGVDKVVFPDLSGTAGFGGSGGTSTNSNNDDPYVADSAYSFTSGATTAPAQQDVAVSDLRGNVGHHALTFLLDNTAPTGGALTVDGLGATTAGASGFTSDTSLAIVKQDYTDDPTGSGLASSTLTVASATLANGACGGYGVALPVGGATFAATSGTCYRFTLTGTDNVGNTASVSVELKVDATPPTQPTVAFDGLSSGDTYDAGNGTLYYRPSAGGTFTVEANGADDPQSGVAGYAFSEPGTQDGSVLHVTFDGSSSFGGAYTVHATNRANLDSTAAPYSVVADSTPPAGGVLKVNGGSADAAGGTPTYLTTGTDVAIDARTDYADGGSGLASSDLTVESAPLAGNACGTFGGAAAVTGTTWPVSSGNCYRFTLTGTDHVGNTASIATTVKVDTTAPVAPTIAFSGLSAGNTAVSGSTLYYRPSASGTFTVDANGAGDPETGLAAGNAGFTFSALNGFVSTAQTANHVTGAFDATSTGGGTFSVVARNNAGVASSPATTFTITPDANAPTGGLLSAAPFSGALAVSLSEADFADGDSGIASNVLTRSNPQAPSAGTCPTGGYSGATAVALAAGSATDTVPSDGRCYQYTLTGTDRVGNSATYRTIVLVDTTGPSGGSVDYASGAVSTDAVAVDWSAGADSQSGIGNVEVQRASATFDGSTCGSLGSFSTLVASATTSPLVDSSVSDGNCYAYRIVVKNGAGVASTFTSPNVVQVTNGSPIQIASGDPAGVYVSGGTVWVGPEAANLPFKLQLTGLGANGVETATWQGKSGGSLTSGQATDTVASNAPFSSGVYEWDGTPGLDDSIQVTRDPGGTVDSVAVKSDTSDPSGTIDLPAGAGPYTSHSVRVTTSASDGQSGLAGTKVLRAQTTLTGSTCDAAGWSAYAAVSLDGGGNDTSVQDDHCYRYEVVATDRVGNTSTTVAGTDAQIADITPPSFVSAATNATGKALTIQMSEPLDATATTPADAFAVTYNGIAQPAPAALTYAGSTVVLTLATAPTNSQTVKVRYAQPSASSDRMRDTATPTKNETPSFGPSDVANDTTDVVAPSLRSASVNGATVTLLFDEALTGTAPDPRAFTVTTGSSTRAVTAVAMSGKTVTLTIAPAVAGSDDAVVSYAVPALDALHDAAGNTTAPFGFAAVNETPIVVPPAASSGGGGSVAPAAPVLLSASPNDGSTVRAASTITLSANESVSWTGMTVTRPDGSVAALPDDSGASATWSFDATAAGLYVVRGTLAAGGVSTSLLSHFTVWVPPALGQTADVPPVQKNAYPTLADVLQTSDQTAAVAWTAGAFGDPVVVDVAPQSPTAVANVPPDARVVSVTAFLRTTRVPVHLLDNVVDIQFKDAGPGSHPLTSQDGQSWREIPQLPTLSLPAGQRDGWFADSDGTVHVLTRHLTYYALVGEHLSTTLALRIVTPRRLWLHGRSFVGVRLSLTAPARVTGSFVAPDGSVVPGQTIRTPTRHAGVTILRVPLRVTKPGLYRLQIHADGLGQAVSRTARIRFFANRPHSRVWQDAGPLRVAVVHGVRGEGRLGSALGNRFLVRQVADASLYDAVDTSYRTAAAAVVVDLATVPPSTLAELHALLPEVTIVGLGSGRAPWADAVLPRSATPAQVAHAIRSLLRGR